VVVRYHLEDGGQTDLVGDLTAVDDALHVTSRHGSVRVALDRVVTGKVVPPRPTRPGPPHLTIPIAELERVMALHWRPLESASLGGWLLRASGGFTGRANSALPLDDPGVPVDAALAGVEDWYRSRGLPAKLSVAGPAEDADARVAPEAGAFGPAGEAARASGWQVIPDVSALVMTARTADLHRLAGADALPPGLTITVDSEPDDAWLASYRYRGQELPPPALPLLNSAPEQVFVSVRAGETTVGVARGSLGAGWAGLTAVEVMPDMRRRGLGTVLLSTVADWGRRSGAVSLYLQVAVSNTTARQVYRGAGLAVHHRYDYLQAP
jgi:GNAT superfamily N-acetyltransferase